MTENKTVFTLTAVLDNTGRLTVKTEGICPNHLVGKVIEEICYQYDEVDINIDKTLVLDEEDGEFYEEVADSVVADAADDEDADDSVNGEGTSDNSDACGMVADVVDLEETSDNLDAGCTITHVPDDEVTSDDSVVDGEVADSAE